MTMLLDAPNAAADDGSAMTTPPSFPTLAGQGWSVHKKPIFSTIVATHVSGREVRDALYQNPIWQFELTFDGLDFDANTYPGARRQLAAEPHGLFPAVPGPIRDVSLHRPDRLPAVSQRRHRHRRRRDHDLHLRPLHGRVPRAGRLGDSRLERLSQWRQPGVGLVAFDAQRLVFATAPGAGVAISATFAYAFQCRFDADDLDFEQFMSTLWKVDSVKFKSVRTS